MSKNSTVDILQPLPFEKWSLIKKKVEHNWPHFAYYYYWIENAIVWKKRNPNISIQMYCPYGDDEQGTFLGISNFSEYNVLIFTLHPNSDIINKVLTETKVIDYNQQVNFVTVHECFISSVLTALENLKHLRNVETNLVLSFNYYFKPAEECIKTKTWIPNECYIKPLDKSNIPLIHSVWPHRDVENPQLSLKYLSTLVEMNGGIGLYLKEDDSLVSWCMQNDWHGLSIVQTVEEHRGKGYAKIVVNMLSKKFAEQGISTVLFIVKGNTTSENMFKKLGWKVVAPLVFIMLKRQVANPDSDTQN
ncbi:uncharacterized protein LOC117231364 [Bombus vosnesenskii]|uniref:Uncharacterized protein LOC117231364 n=2 Tax=Pyrobombus TaxID=144703 RepID=A0A6J3JXS5_9HYME|nr:uncharacterized protein LOC117231364 [Bombus vosnesenskii]